MGVPNTNTFSMSDVKTEIDSNTVYTVTSLQDAFIYASNNGWNATYEGSHNELLNFRDYSWSAPTVVSFATRKDGETTPPATCGLQRRWTRYHDGVGTYPVQNDLIFDTSTLGIGSNPFNGLDLWYGIDDATLPSLAIQINSIGLVIGIKGCA